MATTVLSGRVSSAGRLPVPGEQVADAIDGMVGDAGEHIAQIGPGSGENAPVEIPTSSPIGSANFPVNPSLPFCLPQWPTQSSISPIAQ